jgi:hypothetical protein
VGNPLQVADFAAVLKTVVPVSPGPRVRIPPPPFTVTNDPLRGTFLPSDRDASRPGKGSGFSADQAETAWCWDS